MDIIRLLPDSVSNQIAAGEVVQRPASVVKELIENAIDAGASAISVNLKNVGKGCIQVIDDGKGMSKNDSLLAFKRHATSKISSADDLFSISTLGFRGEALASIASVAEVELKTKTSNEEIGTHLVVSNSEIKKTEGVVTPIGSNITVRDLFFNVPARRKFLKSDKTELRNINNEFIHITLSNPEIKFSLKNDDIYVYDLPQTSLFQRIINIFGKNMASKLIKIKCNTELVKIEGYICSPNHTKKSYGEQFFFVNKRYMRHPYFHKAVMEAFKGLINNDAIPSYFLYFTINPSLIDVNIHPTKTEIKFQNESDIFQILMAGIRESLGKYNITPSIDFDMEGSIEYEEPTKTGNNTNSYAPKISYKNNYNPFNYSGGNSSLNPENSSFEYQKASVNWKSLFNKVEDEEESQTSIEEFKKVDNTIPCGKFIQIGKEFVAINNTSDMVIINIRRAHERIQYERFIKALKTQKAVSQKLIFPENIELSIPDFQLIMDLKKKLEDIGFEIEIFGKNSIAIYGTPAYIKDDNPRVIIIQLLDYYKNTHGSLNNNLDEKLAISLSKSSLADNKSNMSEEEINTLIEDLFKCDNFNVTPEQKKIICTLNSETIFNLFK